MTKPTETRFDKTSFFQTPNEFSFLQKFINKKVLAILFSAMICAEARAQQNIGFRQGSIISPQVSEGNTVTFRLKRHLHNR
jgi:hypothetical protein